MNSEKKEEQTTPVYTKEDVRAYLADIEQKVIESNDAYLHSVLALNQMMRLPNAAELFDDEVKAQMRDLWIKLKSTGIKLTDPPLLFGLPEDFGKEKEEKVQEIGGADGPSHS